MGLQEPLREAHHYARLNSRFILAQNCLERMQALSNIFPPKDNTREESAGDYLDIALSGESLQRSPIEEAAPTLAPAVGEESLLHQLRASAISHPRSPISVDISLSNMRKMHENALLAHQRLSQKSLLQSKKLTSLVNNDAFVKDLLKRRQRLSTRVNSKFNELFQTVWTKARDISTEIKAAYENESRRRSLRNALTKMTKQDQDFIIIEPIIELLSSRTSPIAMLLREFLSRWRQLLQGTSAEGDGGLATKVIEEITFVEHHLVELLQETYEELADPSLIASIKVSVQHYLFNTSLTPNLLFHLHRLHAKKDLAINECFLEFGWQDLFSRLKFPPRLQIPTDCHLDAFPIYEEGLYSRAIDDLRSFSIATTPTAKLLAMMQACTRICQSIEEYFRDQQALALTTAIDWNLDPLEEAALYVRLEYVSKINFY